MAGSCLEDIELKRQSIARHKVEMFNLYRGLI